MNDFLLFFFFSSHVNCNFKILSPNWNSYLDWSELDLGRRLPPRALEDGPTATSKGDTNDLGQSGTHNRNDKKH